MIEARRARPADAEALGHIHATSWAAAYGPFFTPDFVTRTARAHRTRWSARLAEPDSVTLLAELDGRPLALSYTRLAVRAWRRRRRRRSRPARRRGRAG